MRSRTGLALVLMALVSLPAEASAARASDAGTLRQLPGRAGCCLLGPLGQPQQLLVSSDGRNVYWTARKGSIVVAIRDRRSGRLRLMRGRRGCVRRDGRRGCSRARGLERGSRATSLSPSPDGRHLYAVSTGPGGGIALFRRLRRSGGLAQLRGRWGCMTPGGRGRCRRLSRVTAPSGLVASADGRSAYLSAATGPGTGAAVLTRNPRSGTLRQLRGRAGCLNADGSGPCTAVRGLPAGGQLGIGGPGDVVYASWAGGDAHGFAILARDSSGALTQPPGERGCIKGDGSDGCAAGRFRSSDPGLRTERWGGSITLAPDGAHLYFSYTFAFPDAGALSYGRAAFARNPATGDLTQLPGAAGEHFPFGPITALSPDGLSAYTIEPFDDVLTLERRDPSTGELRRLDGRAGCLVDRPAGGDCARARVGQFMSGVALSPDGRFAYIVSSERGISSFRRVTR